MFAGVADYGVYQRCCRENRREKFADLIAFKLVEARSWTHRAKSRAHVGRSCPQIFLGLFPSLLVSYPENPRASPHPDQILAAAIRDLLRQPPARTDDHDNLLN